MQAVNKKLVVIDPLPLENESVIEMDAQSREAMLKKQNRGTVFMVGEGVDWIEKGDVVSFFRAAATEVTDTDEKIYQLVNDAHVLVKF